MDLRSKLQRALDVAGNTHSVQDVADAVRSGEAQLWESESGESFALSSIDEYPQKRVVRIWLAAGNIAEVIELSEDIVVWGKSHGCSHAILSGRKGWERVGKDLGWEHGSTVLVKEIE